MTDLADLAARMRAALEAHQTTLEAPTKLDAPAQPATADPAILGALASSVEAQAPGLSWGRVALGPGEVESRLVAAGEHALTPWWRDVLDGAGDARVVVVRAGRRGGIKARTSQRLKASQPRRIAL